MKFNNKSSIKILFTHQLKGNHLEVLKKVSFDYESIPMIKTEIKGINPSDISNLKCDAWIFTSKNAVKALSGIMNDLVIPSKVFAVGSSTAKKLNKLGIEAIVPEIFSVESLESKIKEEGVQNCIHFCGNLTDDKLLRRLDYLNCAVTQIEVYKTIKIPTKVNNEAYNAVVFLSPSAFESFSTVNDTDQINQVFCIGSTTEEEVKKKYKGPIVIPELFTFNELVNTIDQNFEHVIS
jgi:uroporphyrinogen-III synthase